MSPNLCCFGRREDLSETLGKEGREKPVLARNAEVFATPSRIEVHSQKRKDRPESMTPSYPDICYCLDESHVGFDDLVRIAFKSQP